MQPDAIREMLAGLRQASMMRKPPGTVTILRTRIQEAGADLGEVERWIREHSGELRVAPSVRSRGLRPGRAIAPESGPTPYYVIPKTALAE